MSLKREQRSLFGEILDWMLTPLLVLWPASLALTWLVAQNIAGRPFDRALEYSAQDLARHVQRIDDRLQLRLSTDTALLRMDGGDQVFFQVRADNGRLIGGAPDLPVPALAVPLSPTGPIQLRDAELRGMPVRVAALRVVPDEGGAGALVQVAETLDKRAALASEIIQGVMLPQFVILPLSVLLIWLALARGIRPLHELERRIRGRRPDDLSPIDSAIAPLEVAPLVAAVNDLLQRLRGSIDSQKRFLADAAHQLKTPLAGLRMQADLALRSDANADDLKQSLQQIGRASVRATHTVNQLLALARAEDSSRARASRRCDLAQLTLEVVQDSVPRALEQRIDLGYDGLQPGAPGGQLQGQPTLLQELVRNLVDNALNYTAAAVRTAGANQPAGAVEPGVVTVRIRVDGPDGALLLSVEDNGPGIAKAERSLVFQPFYRSLDSGAEGSGLGLAIVDEIARQHGAQLAIAASRPHPQRPGACVSVRLPPVTPLAASGDEVLPVPAPPS